MAQHPDKNDVTAYSGQGAPHDEQAGGDSLEKSLAALRKQLGLPEIARWRRSFMNNPG